MFEMYRKILRFEYIIRYIAIELDRCGSKFRDARGHRIEWNTYITEIIEGERDEEVFGKTG